MGEIKSTNEKKKSQLRFNVGDGVALVGVVLLGGGLAVAGLMAAFTIFKNRNSGKYYNKIEDSSATAAAATPSEKKHDGSPGLSFVHQNPSTSVHQNSCCISHGTAIIGETESLMDSKELVSVQNMSLEDKTLPIMDGGKEIVVSDDLNKEISESNNEVLNNEESSLPVPENMIKNNSNENLRLMDNIEVEKEEEQADTEKMAVEENLYRQSVKEEEDDTNNDIDVSEEHVIEKYEEIAEGELALKENLPTQSVAEEEEEGDDDDDDNDEDSVDDDDSREDVKEKEEECSEETGSSSMESNVEAILPTEMIEGLSQELKEMNANNQNSGEKKIAKPECYDHLNCKNDSNLFNEHASNNETTETSVMLNEKNTQDLVMEKVENTHLPRREVFVWSLAILLLLLLLHIHRTALVNDLSYQNSVGPRV